MTGRSTNNRNTDARAFVPPVFPFTAMTGQDEMKLALLLNAIAPSIGGVLIMGHRGTGKSTAVRALAQLLPPIERVRGCHFNCDPAQRDLCDACHERLENDGRLARERAPVPVIDLPLGATEDRVCGTIDMERALKEGVKAFEPGLLARANRGFLYIDEVNLLEDHLVDLLLDVAATGRNRVEREGVSTEHPARFVLAGSGNPEEGELRPQLLDRFGLYTEVRTATGLDERVRIVEQREAFDRDPQAFLRAAEPEQVSLRRRLTRAKSRASAVEMPLSLLRLIAELCVRLNVDGHRGEITITRAARALAAFEGRKKATAEDVRRVAAMSLRHRLRRDPLEQGNGGARIDESVEELFGDGQTIEKASDKNAPQSHAAQSLSNKSEKETGDEAASKRKQSEALESDSQREQKREAKRETKRETNAQGVERNAPTADTRLPDDALNLKSARANTERNRRDSLRSRTHSRSTVEAARGRYTHATESKPAGGRIALDATLRMTAPRQFKRLHMSPAPAVQVAAADLRYKRLRRKSGTLYILAVDTSGSMAVNRINQAKAALVHLLRESYIKRDRLALVSFREQDAQLLLAPCAAPARAKRILDALPVGGATPLCAALLRALEVVRRGRTADALRIVLVVFTDGRANVPLVAGNENRAQLKQRIKIEIEQLGAALQRAGVASLVVDTQNLFTSGGEGHRLAQSLGGRYVHLPLRLTEEVMCEVLPKD